MYDLVHGAHGIPFSELIGEGNSQRLVDAVNKLYGIAFALQMDGLRTNVANRSIHGTIAYEKSRLLQSELSTRT